VLFVGGFVSLLACPMGLFLGLDIDSKPTGQREVQAGDLVTEMQLESGMGSFLSSRPCSSKQFSDAILKTAALSAIVSWSMWFVVFGASLLTLWLMKLSPTSYMPKDVGVLFIPMTILGPWIAMANLGMIGLSGRGTKILFPLVIGSVCYCVLFGVIRHFSDILSAMQFHTACTTALAMLLVVVTLVAFVQAQKQKHLSLITSVFAGLASCGLVVAAVALRPAGASFIYYPCAVLFATLVVAPIACMPLAIAWNRHR
jgi:hypothetical protein